MIFFVGVVTNYEVRGHSLNFLIKKNSKTTFVIFVCISQINLWRVLYNLYEFGGGTPKGLEDIASFVYVGALIHSSTICILPILLHYVSHIWKYTIQLIHNVCFHYY